MCQALAGLPACELLFRGGFPMTIDDGFGVAIDFRLGSSRCSAQRRSRVDRTRSWSWQTMFISVSLNKECSFKFAEPIVSQRSSMIPTLAWT